MHLILEEEYAQKASPVSSLRAILEGYPLSAGIFRELVQNSDDAGASKQIFVLDQQHHAPEGLYKEGLASTQGPAFMAYNDAVLSPEDWQALSSLHDSSKSEDESKIGKYGVGFRSVFNITDSPQVLSDQHLAIFDPLRCHLGSEGKRILLEHVSSVFPNQLLPFGFFMKSGAVLPFLGTVIRCPLRSTPSRISDQIVQNEVISRLFQEFVDQELDISCLFLKNINCIEIHEISPTGVSTLLAKMDISRSDPVSSNMFTAAVQLYRNQVPETKEWHIVHSDFSRDKAITSTGIGVIHGAKFLPEVKIAVNITRPTRGRLFSFLPLPIFTGFPVHVHASFGIDASRANLRRDSVGLASSSRDHMKVQWNAMLFQKLIPRTWSYLLKELASRGLVSNIFDFWPPEASSGELASYFSPLSRELVGALLAEKTAVLPVYQSSEFKSLELLVVASPTAREGVLQALARLGIFLTQPPRYIFELLYDLSGVRILTPEVAHGLLLGKVDEITQADEGDQKLLLEYLFSADDVSYICGLPLIPIANGEKIAISTDQSNPSYTMLTRSEFAIFGACDDLAIPLHQLPTQVEAVLLKSGPSSVNVQMLTVSRIVKYLSIYPNRLGLYLSEGRTDSSAVRWLSRFWEWMNAYEHRDELFPQIRELFLLPSTNGLRKAESALFKLRGEHPAYTVGYIAIGVPFLDTNVSDTAHGVLQNYGLARSIWDIPALLDSLASTSLATVSQVDYESILKHLASRLDESIGQERLQRLRHLPIFPVLIYTTTGQSSSVVTNWTAIPKGHKIRSLGRPKFVPLINGISFVGLNNIAPGIVKFLEPSHPNSMSENDLYELAVENFTTQPEHLQLNLLRQVADNRNRIFPDVITKLRSQAFVLGEDGDYHIPGDIVDPDSDIGPLYIGCPGYRPSSVGRFWPEILQCLKSLKLLRAHLTPETVTERIEYISSNHTSDEVLLIARNLLLLLGSSNLNFSLVQGISEKKWLPTNQGLCSAEECRHPVVTPLALFDKVLAVLTIMGRFTMPPLLQAALGWDKPPPISLLIQQLNGVLNSEHNYHSVVEIIKEFGRRQLSDDDFGRFEKTFRDRQWIPTTVDMLADIKSSVFNFSPTMINSGFYQINPNLKAECLLRRMGCTDDPSTRAIIDKLHALDQDSDLVDIVGTSISLLKSLPEVITTRERAKLLIPDKDSRLRPVSKVFYNDIGESNRLMNSDGYFIAHQSVDESLARKLELDRLGVRHADLRNLGPDMGQAPITTVRRTLQQYTKKQFLPEFLANAEDAKATEFKVAINLTTVNQERNLRVLTPGMAYLCKLPSLVVYNNAQFSSKDFEGICRTSVGGKEGRSDTIGEFGQGVLTMYHFTDLAMVISGSRILFLDPYKKHLPIRDRASLDLSLERVQTCFEDHLIALDGLFDFDMTVPTYNGKTLFVLPLRINNGLSSPIIPDFWPPQRVTSEILEPFKTLAGDCLLFTNIRTISCFTRADAIVLQWSFCARKSRVSHAGYTVTDIEIVRPSNSVARWRTVTISFSRDYLPPEFQQVSHFRRPLFAGLAARLDKASDGRSFFSILPLSSPTTLPMHVMAAFKLSSDRRQIRFDNYEKVETRYNTWILEELIPPLYLFFLEHLLNSGDEHYHLRWPTNKNDTLSNVIVKSFYSPKNLTSSTRHLFPSLYSPPLTLSPKDAVLQANDPLSIRLILGLLKPRQVVSLPSGPRELAASAGVVTVLPNFVKSEILRNPGVITSDIDFQLILDVILYLTNKKDTPSILRGLQILPLEDGSFGTLDVRGTGTPYFIWKPKDRASLHNFSERCFVHPEMKSNELIKLKLNISPLDASTIKGFIEAKLSTFPGPDVSHAQLQWTDSFWDSWEEYVSLGLIDSDIESFPLVQTDVSSSLVCLNQCKNGDVLLVGDDTQESHALRTSLRELRLPVVYIDGQIPGSLRKILDQATFPRLNLQNVLSAMSRTGVPMSDLFGILGDDLRVAFANWARANITQIPKDQIPLAQNLPIWWSTGGGTGLALRSSSEVRLLPEKLTLRDAANFMSDCVADDSSLTHLQQKHMTFDELPRRLRLPDVLDMPTLLQYKQFYDSWIKHLPASNISSGGLLVPTSASTPRAPQDLFKRGPLFNAVFPEDSPFFVHSEFQEYEEMLCKFGLRTEEGLDVRMFTACAESLDLDDPNAVPRAREVFLAYSHILPRCISVEDYDAWRELDDIAFIPRRMDTVRRLPDQNENESGLDIPMTVTQLPTILSPAEFVRLEFEAVAWSQRACFEEQPSLRACIDYPALGKPSFSIVLTHLRFLTEPYLSIRPQRRILLNDLREVYQYFIDNLDLLRENEELAQTILFALRDEQLFLNIDEEGDPLNWVQGSSLAFDCNVRDGRIQDVRNLLRPFEKILVAAGALRVQHPSYSPEHYTQQSESEKLQNIWSSFDQLRREKAYIDVEFIAHTTDDPNPEPLFAHRVFLAASSDYFKDYFRGDFMESRSASHGGLHTLQVEFSWQCVRSFLDYIYTRNKGEKISLELLLELLHLSNYYHITDLFDEVQGEIITRRLLRPDTVDRVKAEAEELDAACLLNACTRYESENTEFIRRSIRTSSGIS